MKIISSNPEPHQDISAHSEMNGFLSQYNWDLFCTFTYCNPVKSVEKCIKDIERLTWLATKKQHGIGRHNKSFPKLYNSGHYAPYIYAIEPHKSGSLHSHLLVGETTDSSLDCSRVIDRQILKGIWEDEIHNSGFSKIEKVKNQKKAAGYVQKVSRYLSKNPDAVLDWHGLQGWSDCPPWRCPVEEDRLTG